MLSYRPRAHSDTQGYTNKKGKRRKSHSHNKSWNEKQLFEHDSVLIIEALFDIQCANEKCVYQTARVFHRAPGVSFFNLLDHLHHTRSSR